MNARFCLATPVLEQRNSHTDTDAIRVDRKVPATTGRAEWSSHRRAPGIGFRFVYYVLMFLTGGVLAGVLYLGSISE